MTLLFRISLLTVPLITLMGCSSLFFYPMRHHVLTPDKLELKYEDVYFETMDKVKLHGWYLPAQGSNKGTVLFLHGNAENISTHIGSVYWLPEQGFNVFLFDYRGYGMSEGTPSIEGALKDVEGAITAALSRHDIDPKHLVIFGQSLGGALATYVVANTGYRSHIKALVIESTFSSYRKIFREKAASFWLTWPLQWPLSWTVTDSYSPIDAIKRVSPIPLLVIHGDKDPIVPLHHGIKLYDAAIRPKELWLVSGGGHTRAFRDDGYRERLVHYLEDIFSR